MCLLCFIDLSSAFDTADHEILQTRSRTSFGFPSTVFKWIHSFLSGRALSVKHRGTSQTPAVLACFPQGLVLSSLFFNIYIQYSEHFQTFKQRPKSQPSNTCIRRQHPSLRLLHSLRDNCTKMYFWTPLMSKKVSYRFAVHWVIRSVRRYLLITLLPSLVLSRLDYCIFCLRWSTSCSVPMT